jgi:hypothetical protein
VTDGKQGDGTLGGIASFHDVTKISRREVSMLILDFSERAAEYLRLARRARSEHDRRLFIELACAWCGLNDMPREDGPPGELPH